MNSRRKFLLGTATVGTASIAGCAGLGSSNTLSWEEAFQKHLTDDDASVLEPTPIVIDTVTSETGVKTSLAVLGWTRAGRNVSSETVSQMDGFATTAADLRQTISPALSRLNDVIDLIDDMKETSVLGTSVWDALVSAKPPLEGFDVVARELQTLLEGISNRLGDIEMAAGDMSTQMENIQSQGTTDYDNFPQTAQSLVNVTEDLITDIQDVIDQITEVEELTSEATDAANDLPALGNEVSSTFGSLNTEVTMVRQGFERTQTEIEDVQSAGHNLQTTATDEANKRYEPISNDVTGSTEQMSLNDFDTTVKSYQPSEPGGSKSSQESTDTSSDQEPMYQLRISYEGEWEGTIYGGLLERDVNGTGSETWDLYEERDEVSVSAKKIDQGSDKLTVQILKRGSIIKEDTASGENREAQVEYEE